MPIEADEIKLHMWGGGWGLPSVDPVSLQCLANIRFAGVPVKVEECNNPWLSPKGRIPFVKAGTEYMYTPYEVSTYLRSHNFSADYGLSSVECSETLAYIQYVWDTLQIAYQYFGWIHQANFDDITRPFVGKRLPWVYKMWYPEKFRKRAMALVGTSFRHVELPSDVVERWVCERTQKCLILLSDKLGKKEFFLGKPTPTTIDSVVFSYLAFFWKVPLGHNPVKEFLKATPNLESYLARILQRYFPVVLKKVDGVQSSSSRPIYGRDGEPVASDVSNEYPPSHKIFALLFTAALMIWYGCKNQIVRLPRVEPVAAQDEDDDEFWE